MRGYVKGPESRIPNDGPLSGEPSARRQPRGSESLIRLGELLEPFPSATLARVFESVLKGQVDVEFTAQRVADARSRSCQSRDGACMNVLAVDVGTSIVKAAIVDSNGNVSGSASARTNVTTPVPGAAEIDSRDITRLPLKVMACARASSALASEDISAISVTGARGTILVFDASGQAQGPTIVWTDRRGASEIETFVDALGGADVVTAALGINPDPTLSVAAIMRWQRIGGNRGARRFAGPQATAIERLTGESVTDSSNAGYYGFARLSDSDWNPDYPETPEQDTTIRQHRTFNPQVVGSNPTGPTKANSNV